MKKTRNLLVLMAVTSLCGCATIFLPPKQKITINTKSKESKIFIDDEEVGSGTTLITKVKKDGTKQVVIQTPGYKDAYYALLQSRIPAEYWIVSSLNVLNGFYGFMFDRMSQKRKSFQKINDMPSINKYDYKTEKQKNIELLAIKMNIDNKQKDLVDYDISYSDNLMASFNDAEKEKIKEFKKAEKDNKKKNKKLESDDNKIKYDDTKFSESVYKTLKKTNYADTVSKALSDINNTIGVEGLIKKISVFKVIGYERRGFCYFKTKMEMSWIIKNSFGEILDSLSTKDFSGDFMITKDNESNVPYKMFADAVDVTFLNLMKRKEFNKYLNIDTNYRINDALLSINKPNQTVNELSDATEASVIIKRKDGGHGSAFAISNDGYLLTNFHVIASKNIKKQEEIKVVLETGEEIPVTIVRYNRMRDIALLKVNHVFKKAFVLNTTKSFKNLMEVYTIGAPKSIDLGQSISIGLLSNERKSNKVNLLQLSMSVNPGNSGGPLFDKTGKLHGVVSSKLVGYATEGVGFAIPSYLIPDYLNITVQ